MPIDTHEQLMAIKQTIVDSTIDADQQRVATQWALTFQHNDTSSPAIAMTALMLACIAQGDFRIKTESQGPWQAPHTALTITDYLSHASRIIIDHQSLNPENRTELLTYFAKTPGIDARSSTHAVTRNKRNEIVELKGFYLGIQGQMALLCHDNPRDFGINIAMGGMGRPNCIGQTATDNGYSGHIFFHRNDTDGLLMFGLEQTAPAKSLLSLLDLTAPVTTHEAEQHHTDQFGQGHSLIGASDIYTAAGSLYFSDPIYQAKLLAEKATRPPIKYGGMMLTLTNDNWPDVKHFFHTLCESANNAQQRETLFDQLMSKPKTAIAREEPNLTYIDLDFRVYLQRAEATLLTADETAQLQASHTKLLDAIIGMQTAADANEFMTHHTILQEIIAEISNKAAGNPLYLQTITRIQELFAKQIGRVPLLTKAQQTILQQKQLENQIEQAEHTLAQILEHLKLLQGNSLSTMKPIHAAAQLEIEAYIKQLENHLAAYGRYQDDYTMLESLSERLERYNQLITPAKQYLSSLFQIPDNTSERLSRSSSENERIDDLSMFPPPPDAQTALIEMEQRLQTHQSTIEFLQQKITRLKNDLKLAHSEKNAFRNSQQRALQEKIAIDEQHNYLNIEHKLLIKDHLRLTQQLAQQHMQDVITGEEEPGQAAAVAAASFTKQDSTALSNISDLSFQIIGGFAMIIGALAVALALTMLLTTPPSLVLTTLAAATVTTGILSSFVGGLFYYQGSSAAASGHDSVLSNTRV